MFLHLLTPQNWLHKEKPENVDVERKNKAIENLSKTIQELVL